MRGGDNGGADQAFIVRLLQLSDPHLVNRASALVRGKPALRLWHQALEEGLTLHPDLLLVSGDLCQDESWGGYQKLRDSLERLPDTVAVALLPGNHDHPALLRAALGRTAAVAPAELLVGNARVLLLSSHQAGACAGALGTAQLTWLQKRLTDPSQAGRPLLVALHHPPVAIGDPGMDAIGLKDAAALIAMLQPATDLRAVVFGHIHQHWQGVLPGRQDVILLGCPSTLASFQAVQPCPLNRPEHPGGRLLDIKEDGSVGTTLLRWG